MQRIVPIQAKVQFPGDCFGRLYSKQAPECQSCLVRKKCKRALKPSEKPVTVEDDMKKSKKEKAEKKSKGEKKEEKKPVKLDKLEPLNPKKLGKKYKKDKENCGAREGTAHWMIYQVIRQVYDKGEAFTSEALAKNATIACKRAKIKFDPDARLPRSLPFFVKQGVIARTQKRGIFVKMIS